jgi:putative PIG3 family NAD(P)H quinone oxidoreductase
MPGDIPAEMTVIAQDRIGGPETLRPERRPVPRPRASEVLIRVAAAGVNGADLSQREGKYHLSPGTGDVLGLELGGIIGAVGEEVTEWRVGDAVCALVQDGGYAEYAAVPAVQCLPVPKGLTILEAAALPETVLTVWANVFEHGALRPGETLLVHGGTSGIGTIAIQLAKALGSRVIATAGSAEKCRRCEELGAVRAINYREEDFVAASREATGGAGPDVILDMVGGDYMARGLEALAPGGRLVMLAFKQGRTAELDVGLIQFKHLVLTGSRLRSRPILEKARLVAAVRKAVWPLVESGAVRPVIDSTFPLAEAARAHQRMEGGAHVGKVMLTTEAR